MVHTFILLIVVYSQIGGTAPPDIFIDQFPDVARCKEFGRGVEKDPRVLSWTCAEPVLRLGSPS